MRDISENTVSSKNQLPRSSSIYYIGNENAKLRLLIVGNSITRHAPSAGLGWFGDWGMAASALELDYVHRLTAMLEEAGFDVLTKVHQLATWERGHTEPNALEALAEDNEFNAHAVLFRLGENIKNYEDLDEHLEQFIKTICPSGKTVFTTTAWDSAAINVPIRALAKKRGEVCVELTDIGKREELMAIGKFEHKGVAMHPSDAGMQFIADKTFPHVKEILESVK